MMVAFPEHDLVAYRANPPGSVRGAVIVIQEIWGLVDHIKDVCDRIAAEGYIAIAPDLVGHIGITSEVGAELARLNSSDDPEERNAAQPKLRDALTPARTPEFAAWAIPALKSVTDYALEQEGVNGNLASVGFCFGGTYSFTLAIEEPRLKAAVSFYGRYPEGGSISSPTASSPSAGSPTPQLPKCPVLAFYGVEDHSITDTVPELQERMARGGVDFESLVYEHVGHAFFNDTNPRAYDHATAQDAWQRTLAFWDEHLA